MEIYTNMTWPDDPYRTGQRLYARPAPRLAAFALALPPAGCPAFSAVVYLPLHRTRTMTVTRQTLAFGFRAVGITGKSEAGALAAAADLDLLQARRHAAILAGCMLPGALTELQKLTGVRLRGLPAVRDEWAARHASAWGRARMFDCSADLPGQPSLDEACEHARLVPSRGTRPAVARTVEQALITALVCARHLGRYSWDGTLHIGEIMTASTWDCLPQPPDETQVTGQANRRPVAFTGYPA